MLVEVSNISVSPDIYSDQNALLNKIAKLIGIKPARIRSFTILRRSIDSRKKPNVKVVLRVKLDILDLDKLSQLKPSKGISVKEYAEPASLEIPVIAKAANLPRPVVVGAGPAGLFAALYLARAGLTPVVIERGEMVDDRLATIERFREGGPLNPESNIQFGEGGAGTFSDGKLTTGTKSPYLRFILQTFVDAGAPVDILIDAKPHIGTDKLRGVIKTIREQIISLGGEFRFQTKLIGIEYEATKDATSRKVVGVELEDLKTGDVYSFPSDAVVLAIGHSARDTIEYLNDLNIKMERKPFAVGVRIEHPQSVINLAQYGDESIAYLLGAADYKLACKTKDGRGVYTFCMCPGGEIVCASSEPERLCVNGMSNYARDGKFANSALLVEVSPDDFDSDDVLAGMYLQRDLESVAYMKGQETSPYSAPRQSVGAFLRSDSSSKDKAHNLNGDSLAESNSAGSENTSYVLGTVETDLHEIFPKHITDAIAYALPVFDRKVNGFADPDAQMIAVEARSSSPVRIIRDKDSLRSVGFSGLYPAGEGAGYAGGIMSAASDGMRVACEIVKKYASLEQDTHGKTDQYKQELEQAACALEAGDAVVIPTDTVYGLAIAPKYAPDPQILYDIKKRERANPIAWLIPSFDDLFKFGKEIPDYAIELTHKSWPGNLTIIVDASDAVPEAYQSKNRTIGLRMPRSRFVIDLMARIDSPLAATSANLSGGDDVQKNSQIPTEISDAVLCIKRDSEIRFEKSSTVIDCTGKEPKKLR